MSDIDDAVLDVLRSDDGVAGLVGSRVFHVHLPESATLPAVTYQLISDVSDHTHQGPAGLARARYQFNCWSKSREQAAAVSRAVRLAVTGVNGVYAEVRLMGAWKVSEQSDYDGSVIPPLRRRVLDLAIWHTEDVGGAA